MSCITLPIRCGWIPLDRQLKRFSLVRVCTKYSFMVELWRAANLDLKYIIQATIFLKRLVNHKTRVLQNFTVFEGR